MVKLQKCSPELIRRCYPKQKEQNVILDQDIVLLLLKNSVLLIGNIQYMFSITTPEESKELLKTGSTTNANSWFADGRRTEDVSDFEMEEHIRKFHGLTRDQWKAIRNRYS